jgi:L-alanine-DL-glutamate epimerase-like enolase superfamily enzyme
MGKIDRVRIHEFSFEVPDIGLEQASAGVGNMAYVKGSSLTAHRFAVRIYSDDGASGEYVTHWVGTPASLAQSAMLAPLLLGRDPDRREQIYDDLKRELRAYDHMGQGVLDIALWDLAGKRLGTSVSRLLGGFRERLPTYASTYHGQLGPGGLNSPEAFADFASECKEDGFAGFKIHGWNDGDVNREIKNLRGVRARIGDSWRVMLDPACQLRTWHDALMVGHACDEIGCFWYEDPYRDTGISAEAHRRLRDRLSTPLLITEHVRTLEQKAAFLVAGGCDMIHADPEYDMGITGTMKIAHLCEAFGLDVQLHACGPAHRAVISALRNTHMYEMALIGPKMPNVIPPVYQGYSDQADSVGSDGCVPVPDGPGLGVTYDWDFIDRNTTVGHDFC